MYNRHFELACSLGRLSFQGGQEYLSKDPEHIARILNKPTHDFLAAAKQRIKAMHPRLRAFRVFEYEGRQLVSITRA